MPIVYVDRVFICEAYLGTGVGSRSKCTFHAQGSTTKGSPEIDTDPRFTHLNGLEGQCRPPWKVSHLAPHEFSSLQWRRKCSCCIGADFRRRIRHCHCEQLPDSPKERYPRPSHEEVMIGPKAREVPPCVSRRSLRAAAVGQVLERSRRLLCPQQGGDR